MLICKVKICGITNYEDAIAAVEMGADMLGFNFYPESPRYVSPEKTREILSKIPGFVQVAGVFVNSSLDDIAGVIDQCQINWVQLHGEEDPEFCNQFRTFNVKTMKAIRVKNQEDIVSSNDYHTDAILLDAYSPDKYGGTGLTFDWNIIGNIYKRIFLAGGINPDNAVKAVELGVYGIDVCSGIESEPGKKDHDKMKKLFENIRHLRG